MIIFFLQWKSRCESGDRQRIILTAGRGSGLILRLTSQQYYRYVIESGERQRIILTAGRGSGLILRLTSQQYYRSISENNQKIIKRKNG